MSKRTFLLTGSTGVLGKSVLNRVISEFPEDNLLILSRKKNSFSSYPIRDNINYIYGDISKDDLDNSNLKKEVSEVTDVIHMAADVNWARDLDISININSLGTKRIIDLLSSSSKHLNTFIHLSTAFVEKPGVCEQCLKQNKLYELEANIFNNSYEVSKWQSEKYVVDSGLPWTIIRPSLIIGNQYTGQISSYNGIYHILKAFCLGLVPFIVGNSSSFIDIVPINIVEDSIIATLTSTSNSLLNKIIYTISGENAPSVEELVNLANFEINKFRLEKFNSSIELPSVVSCDTYTRLLLPLISQDIKSSQKKLLKILDSYHPYLSIDSYLSIASNNSDKNKILYLSPPYQAYLSRCVHYWCIHNSAALHNPYKW